MPPISTGLIGFGLAGSAFHAPILAALPAYRIDAIASSRVSCITERVPGARVFSDADALLADPGIELVVIASPDPSHAHWARAALKAGKHVVVDKPFTTTLADARALDALAQRERRVLSVYHNRRWDGDFRTVQSLLDAKQLGRISYFESHFDRFRPQPKTGWREQPAQSDGILFDLGAHLVDQALTLFGPPQAITADIAIQRPAARVSDYIHLILYYDRHRAVLHASSLAARPGPRFLLHGDTGSYVKFGMDRQEAALRAGQRPQDDPAWGHEPESAYGHVHDGHGQSRPLPTLPGDYRGYYMALAAAIRDSGEVPVTAAQAGDVIAILEAARRSATLGRRIEPEWHRH